MAATKTHRYKVTLDLDDPQERALSNLLDALKPRNNGRTSFQRLALINYMATLVHLDLSDIKTLEEAQLAIQAQMILKDEGSKIGEPRLAPGVQRSAGGVPLEAPLSQSRVEALSETDGVGGASENSVAHTPSQSDHTKDNAESDSRASDNVKAEKASVTDAGHDPVERDRMPSPKEEREPASPLKGALAGIM